MSIYTQDLGNNESLSRGVFLQNDGFDGTRYCAMTFSQSKAFSTQAGAVRWLAKRGYAADGRRLPDGGDR